MWVLLSVVLPATAEEAVPSSELVVVTANRFPTAITEGLHHTTVITAKEIAESGAPDLVSLLRREAGFESYQSGGVGQQSSTFMRGTESDHTLVLVDGVRIQTATQGTTALDQIMLGEIDHVEIVRGNVSSLYGSGAIGGVIQIFTKRGAGAPKATIHAGFGTERSWEAGASYGGEVGATRFHVGVSARASEGFSAIRDQYIPTDFIASLGEEDDDGTRNTTFNGNLSHDWRTGHQLGITAFHSDSRVEFDGDTNFFDNSSKPKLTKWSIYSDDQISQRWHSRFTVAQGIDDSKTFSNGVFFSAFKTTNDQAVWQNDVSISDSRRLTVGLEYLQQHLQSTSPYDATRRHSVSAFATYLAEIGNHTLQANVRRDVYSDVGGETTGLAAYGYDFTPRWRVSGSLATAFKAPTFTELYFPIFGNPNLRSERARTAELTFRYAAGARLVALTLFRTDISNLIVAPPPSFVSANIEEARIQGAELSASAIVGETQLRASLTLQDPENRTNGAPLLRRARAFGNVSVLQTLGQWQLGGEIRASGPRDDIHIVTFERIRVGGYAILNLLASLQLGDETRLSVRLENALNTDYQVAHGYNVPRQQFMLLLDHRL